MSFANDTFTDTNGTSLASHTSDSGHTWTNRGGGSALAINTNRVNTVTGGQSFDGYYSSAVPASADYDVQADITATGTQTPPGITGRQATGADTCYHVRIEAGTWHLRSRVAGTVTDLGSYTGDTPSGLTNMLRMVGSSIEVLNNGVSRISVTNSDVTATGRPGVASYFDDGGALRYLDNWIATDAVVGRASKNVHPWTLGVNLGIGLGVPGGSV